MQAQGPHYLLYSEASAAGAQPRWRFVLQSVGSTERLTAVDAEFGVRKSRLELLAVVRGLEALDQPSRVTLVTHSRYVQRGIRRDLAQWRERRWRWERFGKLVPIRDHDLWRRVDRALEFHTVECCAWQDSDEFAVAAPAHASDHDEPPVLVIRRAARRRTRRWSLVDTAGRLGSKLIGQVSIFLRPAFTRAA